MCAHALVTAVRTRADLGFHMKSNGAQFLDTEDRTDEKGPPYTWPMWITGEGLGSRGVSHRNQYRAPREGHGSGAVTAAAAAGLGWPSARPALHANDSPTHHDAGPGQHVVLSPSAFV